MAEQYQPISVNTGSAQSAIQGTQTVTPALENLMQNVSSGFISALDLQKRVADGPLEAATRASELANVQQIRPLQRQVATAQLQNVQAAQEFEASTLPILNATKRANLEQAHNNALQFGAPDEILKIFYASVPNFIPFDPDKLHDKKTGQVNIPYANEMIIKARREAARMATSGKFVGPVKQTTTGPTGAVSETTTIMDQLSGEAVGTPIVTDTKAANTVEAAKVQNQAAEGFRKEFYQADTVQAFNKVDAAVNKIRLAATPTSTPFQDMSAIFGFMKVLDPGSTVREGEYATVEKSRGWPDAFRGLYNKALSGQKLTPEQKAQLVASAEQNYQGQLQNALPAIKQFSELEEKNGFSPGTIVPVEFSAKLTAPAATSTTAATPPGAIPEVKTPDEARALPPTVQFFRIPGGQVKINPSYRP